MRAVGWSARRQSELRGWVAVAWGALGVTQFAGYLQHDNKEETLRVYGETIMPALREHVVAKA